MLSPTTNIAALVAKRNLNENSLQATRSISKVSQGTRIVKPMDDAASLAIANTMRTSLAGMTQGIRNTTQGSSLLQVAAGGMEQTSQMLTRMKQLAVQVINDTLGAAEISYANEEFGQLMQQIDATAEQTRFGGKSLLTGGSDNVVYTNVNRSLVSPNFHDENNVNPLGYDTSAFALNRDGPVNWLELAGATEIALGPQTSGYINHSFSETLSDIQIDIGGGEIRLNIGGEYFSGSSAVRAGGHLVLTSEANSENVLAIALSDDVSTILTDTDLSLRLKQLLVGADIRVGESKVLRGPPVASWNSAGFNTTNPINVSQTRGIIQGTVRHNSDISVTGETGNYTVNVIIGGQRFRANHVDPQLGETLVLKSLDNPGTQIGLNYTEDPAFIGTLSTAADFKDTLSGLFITFDGVATGGGGTPQNALSISEGIAYGEVGRRLVDTTRGDVDASFSSVDVTALNGDGNPPWDMRIVLANETFRAIVPEFEFGDFDRIYFVSTTNEDNVLVLQHAGALNLRKTAALPKGYKEYTAADILNGEFTNDLTEALMGRRGVLREPGDFLIGDPQGVALDYSDSLENGFNGLNQSLTKGFIDGLAKNVSVSGPEGGPFSISVEIGNQIFTQQAFGPGFSGNLTLVSETDPNNVIAFKIAGNAKVEFAVDEVWREEETTTFLDFNLDPLVLDEGDVVSIGSNLVDEAADLLSRKETLLPALESLFGLGERGDKAPAKFFSASSANDGFNGVSMGINKSFTASLGTEPGKYAVSYDATTRTAKLTNGARVFEVSVDPDNVRDGQIAISFGNGVTFRLGEEDGKNPFDINESIAQMVFEVKSTEDADLGFQVSDLSRDDMDIKIEAMTVAAMGLTGVTINGKEQAREAQERIDRAITAINTGLANIGAQQSRFEFVRVNLTIQMENTTAARATYYDVDMAGEITDFTKFQTLTQAATSMLSQANQIPQELLRLLP